METIAFRIRGDLENQSSLGIVNEYPMGQNLRGAFGYIFLDMGLNNISETYGSGHPVLYFRDCLIRHSCRDNGLFVPSDSVYKCNKCGYMTGRPISKDKMVEVHLAEGGVRSRTTDILKEKNRFSFDVIVNMKNKEDGKNKDKEEKNYSEKYLSEFLAAIRFVEKEGIYIGKRNAKGMGKMKLSGIEIDKITMDNIMDRVEELGRMLSKDDEMTIHLISDTVAKSPITGDDLIRYINNTMKFFGQWNTGENNREDNRSSTKIELIGKSSESREVGFLDCKNEEVKYDKENAISRGSWFIYKITDLDENFLIGLAMTEILRGIGNRTSFGKGQFILS